MAHGDIQYALENGVATLTIDRPERANALTWEAIGVLRDHFRAIATNDDVRVVVVTGAGEKAFCAGADLAGMGEGASFDELHQARGTLADLFDAMWSCGRPTIARVFGYALAGGFGLAAACDLVIASDDATFGAPEINIGLWPFMVTVPLARSVPPKKALELMMTGRRFDAAEADALGLCTKVVPRADLDGTVNALAAELADKPAAAMRLGRNSFYELWGASADVALPQLHALLTLVNQTDDAAEGLAAFAEKRPPKWSGK